VHFARSIEEVGLDGVIGRIKHAHTVGDDRVSVIIRSERIGGHAPDTLIVFLHGQGLGMAFDRNGNFLDVGTAEAERDAIIGMDLGRDQRRRLRLCPARNGREQEWEQAEECAFHGPSLCCSSHPNTRSGALSRGMIQQAALDRAAVGSGQLSVGRRVRDGK